MRAKPNHSGETLIIDTKAKQRGIQSIEVGGQVLRAMVHVGRPMALKEIAKESSLGTAKVHPYLVSYGRMGLISQDAETGRYFLGPFALQLGLISLKQNDPVNLASPAIRELALRLGHTVALSVWGSRGPTIVRLEESPSAVHVNMRHGTVFSLAGTATGRLFAAFKDAEEARALLEVERKWRKTDPEPRLPGMPDSVPTPTWREFERELAEVRANGVGRSQGETLPGVNALSAPVFDYKGAIVLAITAIGPAAIFDVDYGAEIAQALRGCARQLSQRLGAPDR